MQILIDAGGYEEYPPYSMSAGSGIEPFPSFRFAVARSFASITLWWRGQNQSLSDRYVLAPQGIAKGSLVWSLKRSSWLS